jgi:outer membrane protein insertion porin family
MRPVWLMIALLTALSGWACERQRVNVLAYDFRLLSSTCVEIDAGYDSRPGSFTSVGVTQSNLLRLHETLRITGEFGLRARKLEAGIAKQSWFGRPIETDFSVYGERYRYTPDRESSIFAFQRTLPAYRGSLDSSTLHYRSENFGAAASARYRWPHSSFGLAYRLDVNSLVPLTQGTGDYYYYLRDWRDPTRGDPLNNVRTARIIPEYTYRTLDNAEDPSRGVDFRASAALAGVGGNTHTIEPSIEGKYFHPGFRPRHTLAMRIASRMIAGYLNQAVPPFQRYYIGGESDVRGFDSGSLSPIGLLPGQENIFVLDSDGTIRATPVIVNGLVTSLVQTLRIPINRTTAVGGDTSIVSNLEYRIPLQGPLTLVLFADTGTNLVTFPKQLFLSDTGFSDLSGAYPNSSFRRDTALENATRFGASSGVEIQVNIKELGAPLRFYFAENIAPLERSTPPLVVDRAQFPNSATFNQVAVIQNKLFPSLNRRYMFRFAIGRTF